MDSTRRLGSIQGARQSLPLELTTEADLYRGVAVEVYWCILEVWLWAVELP